MFQGDEEGSHTTNEGIKRSGIILKARVASNMDGIDMDLFEKALNLRREYESNRGLLDSNNSPNGESNIYNK